MRITSHRPPTTTHRWWATTLALVLATSLAGCGKLAEEAIEQAVESDTGEDVEIDFDSEDGSFSIEGENGESFNFDLDAEGESSTFSGTDEEGNTFEMSTGSGELPDEWPDDVPVPRGTVNNATVMTDNDEQFISAGFDVDDAERSHDDYVAQLQTVGFTVGNTSTSESDGSKYLYADLANDGLMVSVTGLADEYGNQLIVAIQTGQ